MGMNITAQVTFNELADDTPFSLRLEGYIVRLASVAVSSILYDIYV